MKNDLIHSSDLLKILFPLGLPKTREEWNYGINARAVYEAINKTPVVDAVELPFKPGDDLWYVAEYSGEVKCDEGAILGVAVMADGTFKIVSDQCKDALENPGDIGVWLTKEAAEAFANK